MYYLNQKEKGRQIESRDKRLVHFLFKTGHAQKMSNFARDYLYFQDKDYKLDALTTR